MNINEIKEIKYTDNPGIVLINNEKYAASNSQIVEGWRNQGNEVLPYQPTIEEIKQEKIQEILSLRDSLLYKSISYKENLIPNTDKAKKAIMAKYQLLQTLPAGSTKDFVTATGNTVSFTFKEYEELYLRIEEEDTKCYCKAGKLSQKILNLTLSEEDKKEGVSLLSKLQSFDVETEWQK